MWRLFAIFFILKHVYPFQTCLEYLDSGAREALNDVINKVLRKTLKEPESKEPDIDDTILT